MSSLVSFKEIKNAKEFFEIANQCDLSRRSAEEEYQTKLNEMVSGLFEGNYKITDPIFLLNLKNQITEKQPDLLKKFLNTDQSYLNHVNCKKIAIFSFHCTWISLSVAAISFIWACIFAPQEAKENCGQPSLNISIISLVVAGVFHIITGFFCYSVEGERLKKILSDKFIHSRRIINVKEDEVLFNFLSEIAQPGDLAVIPAKSY